MVIEWTSSPSRRGREEEDSSLRWGVKLTIKPLMGAPTNFTKQSVQTSATRQIYNRLNNDLQGWLQLLNLMTFLAAAFSR